MAWKFDVATDKILVASGWSGGVATVLMWIRRSNTTTTHGNNPFRAWSNAAGGGSTLAGLDAQGSSRNTLLSYDSAFSNITGGAMGDATWHPIALLMNGTAWALFYNTGADPSALTKVTGTKAATGTVGSFTLSDAAPDFFDGEIAAVKVFSRALSDAEVAAELGTYDQVSATNLIFRATLKTSSGTPETGTAMTAGATAVDVVDGPTRLLQPAVFAGSAPRATGTLAATETDFGAVAGSAPQATGTLAAVEILPTAVAGSAPHPVGALVATEILPAAVAGSAPHPVGALTGTAVHVGVLAGSAPHAVGALAGAVRNLGVLAGSAPHVIGDMFGGTDFGALAGSAPSAVGRLRTIRHPLVAAGGPDGAVLLGGPVAAGADGGPVAEFEAAPAATGAVVLS
jgi:hypothetical protein